MTFDEAHQRIKKGDLIALRRSIEIGLNVDLANRFSWTLLMLAALEGNTAIGNLLLEHGANVHATNDFGETALSLAAHEGHGRFVQLMMDHGAKTDCRPHGWQLADWLQMASGMPPKQLDRVLDLLGVRPSSAPLN